MTQTSFPSWEYILLDDMGAPDGTEQLVALNLWAASEGLANYANNWLAIQDPNGEFGTPSGQWNSDGVVMFATVAEGASAITNFMTSGAQYTQILATFRSATSTMEQMYDAINMSGWNTGNVLSFPNQGGQLYPVALYDYLLSNNDITTFSPIDRPGPTPVWTPTTPTAPTANGENSGSGFFMFMG